MEIAGTATREVGPGKVSVVVSERGLHAGTGWGCTVPVFATPMRAGCQRSQGRMQLAKMNRSAHIVVRGMVQGVGFRYFVQHHATQLGVTGWVRNLPNGDVEIEAEGSRESVESLILCARRGPRFAVVSNADVTWTEPLGMFERFEITDY